MSEWAIDEQEQALLEAADLAVSIIKENKVPFVKEMKVGVQGRKDFCTWIDREIQKEVVSFLKARYPDHGFLHEEADATIKPWDGESPYFTIDPVDGTQALIDNQLHLVCVMIAMVDADGREVAGCIKYLNGDAYSFGPSHPHVFYTSEGNRRPLDASPKDSSGLVLLRRPFELYRSLTYKLIEQVDAFRFLKECLGIWTPRLWQREFCAGVLWHDSAHTPWDMTPIIAMSRRLGYVFLRATRDGKRFECFDLKLPTCATIRGYDLVIIHKNDLSLVEPLLRK
ncbi:MAG: inositol monophosphatase family protein [Patescibacteria group bacterium]